MSKDRDHDHSHPHDHDHDHHHHDHGHDHHHAHAHAHAHDHDHDHDHAHDHAHPREHQPRARLERGAGRGKLLYFDCFSGVAGDMTIAALIDLGAPVEVVRQALAGLPLQGYELGLRSVDKSSIAATKFDVHVAPGQPQRSYGVIEAMLAAAELDAPTRTLAQRIFRRLGEAEAETHRVPLSEVHFHEVGAVDAIVDIVGAAALLAYLEAELWVSPLPMGRGFVRAQHGVLPLPAPATVLCLRGAPTYGVELEAELVTPTGAAIVATAAAGFSGWPGIEPAAIGYGAGERNLPDRPNLLRAVLGARVAGHDTAATHVVVEANVDDLTGELAGHALAQLLAAGALDAWATPVTMKKGRPGLTIAALAPRSHAQAVAQALLRETTTIGLRTTPVSRIERPRTTVHVDTAFGRLPLKVSGGDHGPPQVKPEFEACAIAAAAHGVPVRAVLAAALAAYRPED